jgi:long-chain fatty acid transport protein
MEGDETSAFGFNLGLMYKPTDRFSAGVSFHSEVEYNFEGTVTSTPALPILPAGDITADLTTPMNIAAGVAYKFTPDLLIAADFQYVGWESYDSLTVVFANATRSSSAREYENSFIARLGAQYQLSNTFGLQAGVYYDKNPVKEERINPTLPESDRLGLSLGLAYNITGTLGVQASYLYIHSFEMEVTKSKEYLLTQGVPEAVRLASALNGTYKSNASVFSLSFSYGF